MNSRPQKLGVRAHDSKPIWEQVIQEIVETRREVSKRYRIAIAMSCANCTGIDTAKVYEFIAKHGSDYEAYALRPRPGMAAALDFYLVLSSAASVASLAGFLWMAYDRLIAPKKRGAKDDAAFTS